MSAQSILRKLWSTAPPRFRPAEAALELLLRPSTRLRAARRLLLLALPLYSIELLLTGHRAAPLLVLLASAGFWPLPGSLCAHRKKPRYLVLAADGRVLLRYEEGAIEEAQLQPESVRIGSHLLLVLRGEGQVLRLLLGPDNLSAAELAALRRRLPAGPVVAGTALHSPAVRDNKSNPT